MIAPNRENIDRWLFDYTEGNLSLDQEAMLENFILNNPDIEVDLDAWDGSKLVSEEFILPDKDKLKRKRRAYPVYFASIFVLLILGSIWTLAPNSIQKDKFISKNDNREVVKIKVRKSLNSLSTEGTFNVKSNMKSIEDTENKSVKNSLNSKLVTTQNSILNKINNFPIDIRSKNSGLNIESDKKTLQLIPDSQNDKTTEFANSNKLDFEQPNLKRIDLKSIKLDHYQIRNEDLHFDETQNNFGGINLGFGKVKLLQKIEKVLEKDLGLSNIPDHVYAIPEYSNIDVLFSNIGATSQFRFQSLTMGRWIENLGQRKFSQQITLDGYSRGAQSGFGLQANYEYFANGSIQNWNTCLLFSPKIALSRSISFEPALRFKLGNKLLNEDRIENQSLVNFESQNTNKFNFDSSLAIGSKLWYRDLDLGFTINTPYFYLGGQVSNVLRHQNNIYSNFENIDMRAQNVYNAIIGTQYISRNQKVQFSPYFFFERVNSNRIFAGFSFKINKFMIGGSYGTGNITSGTLGLSFKKFSLHAQSSYGYAQAIAKNSFTHQLTIRFNSNVDKKSRRYITF